MPIGWEVAIVDTRGDRAVRDGVDAGTAEAARISPVALHHFVVSVLSRVGMSDEDAAITADAMVWADLRGLPERGSPGRLRQVVDRVGSGVNPRPDWTVVNESSGISVLDADGGWGQIAGTRAMRLAIAKARTSGIAATVVRNGDVAAALGCYPDIAIRERMIGLAINNSDPTLAPWGSTTKLWGNQASAVGAPARRHHPILFDSALSAISLGGIKRARDRGEELPPGVALDRRWNPTVDPIEAVEGLLLPMGGHRGSGLALMWEVLTGVLAGSTMAPNVGGTPLGVSMFCLAIDPAIVMASYDEFVDRVDGLIDQIHASSPSPGVERIRIPGERGYKLAARHERDGIPLTREHVAELDSIGQEVNVPWPA